MQLSSTNRKTTIAFAATAMMMTLSPSSVQSFQPIRSAHQMAGPLKALSSPEQSEPPSFFASPRAEQAPSSPTPTPEDLPFGASLAATEETAAAVAVEARTMDEGIYGFNKKLIDTVYDIICFLYPVTGSDRDFARFYVLETVARVPYFAYLSVMHLRETFGERYDSMSERMRTHYAEADNELHHLLIMESLGGNSNIIDRTIAQTMAFFYYWYVIVIYAWNEPAAYHLSELIEDHAFDTYSKFTATYEERLKNEPVPDIARKYYERDNPFLFDLFCTVKNKTEEGTYSERRPQLSSLYDVFVNIRDDEREHWKTLCNLVQFDDMNAVDATEVRSTTPAPANSALP